MLSIKIDSGTKRELQRFAAELGVTTTTFVNASIRQALRDRRLVLTTELEPTPFLEKILRRLDSDLKSGQNITTTHSADDALAHLKGLMRK